MREWLLHQWLKLVRAVLLTQESTNLVQPIVLHSSRGYIYEHTAIGICFVGPINKIWYSEAKSIYTRKEVNF